MSALILGGSRSKKKQQQRPTFVQSFGRNYFYQHEGDSEDESFFTNQPLPADVCCSHQSTLVVIKGKVYQKGALHGRLRKYFERIEIPLPSNKVLQIAAGRHFCLARLEAGQVVSWGAGHFGQLGILLHGSSSSSSSASPPSTPTFTNTPVLIERLLPHYTGSPIVDICAGDWHGLALTENGKIWAWGSNRNQQCGFPLQSRNPPTPGTLSLPMPLSVSLPAIRQIAAGKSHSCALTKDDGTIYCWGSSQFGQCGTGTTTRRHANGILPTRVEGLPASLEMIQIAAGGNHTISLSKAGRVFCWGDGREGQLGLSTYAAFEHSSKPRLVADLDFVAIAAGHEFRQQPPNATAESLSTVPKITSVYAASGYSAAVSSSGHLYCWGSNDVGQLGGLSKEDKPSPGMRDLHVTSFDSNHNILLPCRVKSLQDMEVKKVGCGPNHLYCFGFKGNDNIVGRTLYEVQEEERRNKLRGIVRAIHSGETTTATDTDDSKPSATAEDPSESELASETAGTFDDETNEAPTIDSDLLQPSMSELSRQSSALQEAGTVEESGTTSGSSDGEESGAAAKAATAGAVTVHGANNIDSSSNNNKTKRSNLIKRLSKKILRRKR